MGRMNIYETIIILNPETKTRFIFKTNLLAKVQSFSKTKKVKLNDIGIKNLAYEIKGCKTGYYLQMIWQGTCENVAEIEKLFRTDDNVIKFITVIVPEEDLIHKQLEDLPSEQKIKEIDAWDVLYGRAKYN